MREVGADQPSSILGDRCGQQRHVGEPLRDDVMVPVEHRVELAMSTSEALPRVFERGGDLAIRQGDDPLHHGLQARRTVSGDVVGGHEQLGDDPTRVGNEAHRALAPDRERMHENSRFRW
jgi:hypothetical protein